MLYLETVTSFSWPVYLHDRFTFVKALTYNLTSKLCRTMLHSLGIFRLEAKFRILRNLGSNSVPELDCYIWRQRFTEAILL